MVICDKCGCQHDIAKFAGITLVGNVRKYSNEKDTVTISSDPEEALMFCGQYCFRAYLERNGIDMGVVEWHTKK